MGQHVCFENAHFGMSRIEAREHPVEPSSGGERLVQVPDLLVELRH